MKKLKVLTRVKKF